jgi:hypothetical protein
MVLGINAPTTGNTLDAFIASAKASTSQTGMSASFPASSSSTAGTYTSSAYYASSSVSYGSSKDISSGDIDLSKAISDSDSDPSSSSDSNASINKLLNYIPAILGLLSGTLFLLLVLLVLAIVMIRHHGWKGVTGAGATRNLAPSYRPIQLDGPGGARGGMKEMEGYHDSEVLYAEGPSH